MMMRKRFTIPIVIGLFILFQACSKLIYPVYPIPEYTGSINWELRAKKAEWPARWDHSAVSYQDKIWIFGGYNPGNTGSDSYLEDVWNSSDGKEWHQVTEAAPWHGRRGHATLVFDDGSGPSIYLIGGYSVNEETGYRQYNNDVWKSSDGSSWEQIKTNTQAELDSRLDWYPRFNHRSEVLNLGGKNYIYLIAGAAIIEDSPGYMGMSYFNDVWRSDDGISWERLDNNDFGIRAEHATTMDNQKGILYMQGGTYGIHDVDDHHLDKPVYQWQELWSSKDGIHWEAENDEINFPQSKLYRTQHQIIHYKGNLWGFPGKSSSSLYFSKNPNTYAIWKIDNTGIWEVDSEGPPFMPMYGYTLTLHNNSIFVMGGHAADRGPSNRVWLGEL